MDDQSALLNTADTYAGQVTPKGDDQSFIGKTAAFIGAMPGAVASDAINSSGSLIKFFGGDGWSTDEHDTINNLDVFGTGAASYYDTHKGLVDGAELLATSVIPGTFGIKALHAAQSGISGMRITASLGLADLISPKALDNARKAAESIAEQNNTVWNIMTGELGKALTFGVTQNVLDMAAFGAASMAATNASPIYAGMTPTDMVKDWAEDSVIFGIGGAAYSKAKTFWGLREAAASADMKMAAQRSIFSGNESDPSFLRIAALHQSLQDAMDASNKSGVPLENSVINAVRNHTVNLAQSYFPESDQAARNAIGSFAAKFTDGILAGDFKATESADAFARMIDIRRMGASAKLASNELPIDMLTGDVVRNTSNAAGHLGDMMHAGDTLNADKEGNVWLNQKSGGKVKFTAATGIDEDSLLNTHAAWWRSVHVPLPNEIEMTDANIPTIERGLQEARLAELKGTKFKPSFVDAQGNKIDDLDVVQDLLKKSKEDTAMRLADPAGAGWKPADVATMLNVSTKWLDNPASDSLMLRGTKDIGSFIESPRTLIAKYDLGNAARVPGAKYRSKGFTPTDRIGNETKETPANVFDATLKRNYFKERLVTGPVTRPFIGSGLSALPDAALENFKTVGEALYYVRHHGNAFDKALIDALNNSARTRSVPLIINRKGNPDYQKNMEPDAKGYVVTGKFIYDAADASTDIGRIYLRPANAAGVGGANARTLLHEALHADLAQKIDSVLIDGKGGAALTKHVKELQSVFAAAKAAFVKYDTSGLRKSQIFNLNYGLTDVHEFISVGLTDPTMQVFLKTIKGTVKRTRWSDFVVSIRNILGLAAQHDSALADLIDITDRINTTNIGDNAWVGDVNSIANASMKETAANTQLYEDQARKYISNILNANRAARELTANSINADIGNITMKEGDVLSSLESLNRTDSGASFIASANGGYGKGESFLQKLGLFSKAQKDKAAKEVLTQLGASTHLLANDLNLCTEFQLLRTKLATTAANYVLDPDGGNFLVRQDLAINRVLKEAAEGSGKAEFKPIDVDDKVLRSAETIPVSEKLMNEVLIPHTSVNNARIDNKTLIDNALMPGSSANLARRHGLTPMYNIPINTQRNSHFLFVTEANELMGNGSTPGMIMSPTAEGLLAKRAQLEATYPNRFNFHSKADTRQFYKAQGEYNYQRGMNESFTDSAMRRAGVLGDMIPAVGTDGVKARELARNVAEEFQGFHQRMAQREVMDTMSLKYADVIERLGFMAKNYEDIALSRFGSAKQDLINSKNIVNPYDNMINMMLDKSNTTDFPMWHAANAWVERMGDTAFAAVSRGYDALMDSGLKGDRLDAEVIKLNKMAENVGLEGLYTKGMVAQFGQQLPLRPVLRSFIAKTQAVLNGMMLGLDPMQAVNMALGQVTFAAEFKSLLTKIRVGDQGAGALKDLMQVNVPGTNDWINSAVKLHARSSSRFVGGGTIWDTATKTWKEVSRADLIKEYTNEGLLTHIAEQFNQQMSDIAMTAKVPTDMELSEKVQRIMDRGRTLTGNNLAVEYMRFVAVDAARQLTDLAMSKGLIADKATASTYWNTAVNRMHGISVASQRAQVFQGVIGHAIGMFMTFQHNLFQQLFRYVGTGDTPAMKAMMASQLGLYGIQGLPAFNAVSTHIIGNASGNTNHTDPYSWTAKNLNAQLPGNSTAAEWILYGAGSNMLGLVNPDLKANLYSRGEFNPRELTVFPISPTDTVMYKATSQAIANVFDTVGNIANGADTKAALLHGLEHNGLNRPLAGLGVVLGGQQTTQSGKNIGSVDTNGMGGFLDKFTLANFVRIAGAKPLDDAASADAMYRIAAYQAKTTSDIKNLSESMRLNSQNGAVPDPDQMEKFMQEYAKRGGDIRNFRSFAVNAYKTANTNQVAALAMKMRSPGAQQVQNILGATNDRAWMQMLNGNQQGQDSGNGLIAR